MFSVCFCVFEQRCMSGTVKKCSKNPQSNAFPKLVQVLAFESEIANNPQSVFYLIFRSVLTHEDRQIFEFWKLQSII